MSDPQGVDADQVLRRLAEQAAATLVEHMVRNAILETQLAATRETPPPGNAS